jgi:Cyclin, N-terminal domain
MDRYFKAVETEMKASDLHLAGIVSMFIASKYEDVIPLLMKTIVNKIGHNKFTQEQIQVKEIEILKAISFKIGSPTVKEHLDRYYQEISPIYKVSESLKQMCLYIGKLSCHNYNLMQIPTSRLAITILRIALKI